LLFFGALAAGPAAGLTAGLAGFIVFLTPPMGAALVLGLLRRVVRFAFFWLSMIESSDWSIRPDILTFGSGLAGEMD